MRELGETFCSLTYRKGVRVAYYTEQSATEPEQAGLVYGDKGTIKYDYEGLSRYVYVQWDKGFTHPVSTSNLRLLELLEELCDDPPSSQV
jgi:hypothetical protein